MLDTSNGCVQSSRMMNNQGHDLYNHGSGLYLWRILEASLMLPITNLTRVHPYRPQRAHCRRSFQRRHRSNKAFLKRGPQLANLLTRRQMPAKTAVSAFHIAIQFDVPFQKMLESPQ